MSDLNDQTTSLRAELRHKLVSKVLRLLAQQEQSRSQLATKLARTSKDRELNEDVLNDLENQGIIDDDRATKAYLEERMEKGFGPWSLRQGLAKRGLATNPVDDIGDQQWQQVAVGVLESKFRSDEKPTFAEQQKGLRFLASRGFPEYIVRQAMDQYCDQCNE